MGHGGTLVYIYISIILKVTSCVYVICDVLVGQNLPFFAGEVDYRVKQ